MEPPGLLRGSKYADDVPLIVDRFDKKTKLRFVDSTEPQFVKFGRIGDRDPKLNIKSGQLKLLGWVQCQHCFAIYVDRKSDPKSRSSFSLLWMPS